MKKHLSFPPAFAIAFIFVITLAAITQTAKAQDTTVHEVTTVPQLSKKDNKTLQKANAKFNKNTFKVNVSSLGIKNYHFTYERMLARKLSASVGYRTMPYSRLSDLKLVKTGLEFMGNEEAGDLANDLGNIQASNKAITLELRLYKGRKPGAKGFYTGLFGRYGDFNVGYQYAYMDGSGKSYLIPIQAKANTWSGGIQFGVQFNLLKHVTVDLQYLGLHYGKLEGNAAGVADLSTMSDENKQGLKAEIENMSPYIKEKRLFPIEAQVNDNGIKAKLNGPFAGLRGGINIGIAL